MGLFAALSDMEAIPVSAQEESLRNRGRSTQFHDVVI
jgi:hypothetical protein